jgi:hypothetical protein
MVATGVAGGFAGGTALLALHAVSALAATPCDFSGATPYPGTLTVPMPSGAVVVSRDLTGNLLFGTSGSQFTCTYTDTTDSSTTEATVSNTTAVTITPVPGQAVTFDLTNGPLEEFDGAHTTVLNVVHFSFPASSVLGTVTAKGTGSGNDITSAPLTAAATVGSLGLSLNAGLGSPDVTFGASSVESGFNLDASSATAAVNLGAAGAAQGTGNPLTVPVTLEGSPLGGTLTAGNGTSTLTANSASSVLVAGSGNGTFTGTGTNTLDLGSVTSPVVGLTASASGTVTAGAANDTFTGVTTVKGSKSSGTTFDVATSGFTVDGQGVSTNLLDLSDLTPPTCW